MADYEYLQEKNSHDMNSSKQGESKEHFDNSFLDVTMDSNVNV